MAKETLFWVLMLIWLVFFGWREAVPLNPWSGRGYGLMTFILFLVLGWSEFGPPIK